MTQTAPTQQNIPWRSVEGIFAEMESHRSAEDRRNAERYYRDIQDEREYVENFELTENNHVTK